jgi:large subunit ribosomal protein L29
MNINEIRNKSKIELMTVLIDLSREQFNLKMQKSTGQLARPDRIKLVRKEVARIHTVLQEKMDSNHE